MKIIKTRVIYSLLVGHLTVLSGCGTMTRGDSMNFTRSYPGFEADKKVVSNPYFWMFSLGLYPIFSIISMPADIVIDTILYPYDVHQYDQLMKRTNTTKSPFRNTDNTASEPTAN
jgi:uncharacterized protein YceK